MSVEYAVFPILLLDGPAVGLIYLIWKKWRGE